VSVRWRGREGHGAERVVNLCSGGVTSLTSREQVRNKRQTPRLTSCAIFGLTNAFDNLCSYCHRCSLFDFEELVHLVCGSHRDVWNWKLNSNGKRWFREAEKDRGVRRTKDESDRTKDEKTSRLPKPGLLPICKPFLSALLVCCCVIDLGAVVME